MTRPAEPLTADLCARAIVASARSYGIDPIAAMTRGTIWRRPLAPASEALTVVTGLTNRRVAAVIGSNASQVSVARKQGGESYQRALTAALLAIGGARAALAPDPHAPPSPRSEPEPGIEGEFRVQEDPAPPRLAPPTSPVRGGSPQSRALLAAALRKRQGAEPAQPKRASARAPRTLVDDDEPEIDGRMGW